MPKEYISSRYQPAEIKRNTEEQTADFLLYKVSGDYNREWFPWPLDYKIPRNAAVGIGVPPHEEGVIVIAFSPRGKLHSHASLETVVKSLRSNNVYFPAFLTSYNGKCLLEIPVLSEEERQTAETAGFPTDPIKILTEKAIQTVVHALKADDYCFMDDTRNRTALREAKKKRAQEAPKNGLSHLLWKSETTYEG